LADLVAKLIFPRPEHAASFIQRFIWVAKKSIFNFLLGFGFFFIFGTLYVTIGNKAGLSVGFLDRLHLAFFSDSALSRQYFRHHLVSGFYSARVSVSHWRQ
jgi:hypothetical protein